jgi:hypothetical protein
VGFAMTLEWKQKHGSQEIKIKLPKYLETAK